MQQFDQLNRHASDEVHHFFFQLRFVTLVKGPGLFDVAFEAEPHDHCVKLLQKGAEVENEIVANESEERVFAFLKEVVLVLEAVHVVSMQVVEHVVAAVLSPLKLLPLSLLVLSVVDADECEMQLVVALSQQPSDLVELVGENDFVDPPIVEGCLPLRRPRTDD